MDVRSPWLHWRMRSRVARQVSGIGPIGRDNSDLKCTSGVHLDVTRWPTLLLAKPS